MGGRDGGEAGSRSGDIEWGFRSLTLFCKDWESPVFTVDRGPFRLGR